jgi:hypothetical protein
LNDLEVDRYHNYYDISLLLEENDNIFTKKIEEIIDTNNINKTSIADIKDIVSSKLSELIDKAGEMIIVDDGCNDCKISGCHWEYLRKILTLLILIKKINENEQQL